MTGNVLARNGSLVITASAVVCEDEVLRPGWLVVDDGRVTATGSGPTPREADLTFDDGIIVPGFVDMHVHGGGGASYTDGDPDDARRAVDFHRTQGTTTTLASLVSADPDVLVEQIRGLRELVDAGDIAGIHLEGPWLSHDRCGAHDPAALRSPTRSDVGKLLDAGDGSIRMVTLAPELDGALPAIEQLTDAGVVVAIGHTEATYDQTRAAIAAGARVGTHLFNAMRPLHHREPGPALALLEDPSVTVEVVGDGVHVHPSLAAYVEQTAGPDRVALVTDAMAAAGMIDGSYRLGVLDVDVVDSVARVRATGAIAGSTATMARLFERSVRGSRGDGLLTDSALLAASAMTSSTPARALRLGDVGELAPGRWADFVVLDDAGWVQDVYRRGARAVRVTA